MTTRQELLTQWQQRLAEAQQACLAVQTPAWSDRLRVKLYHFLLAMYGHTPWPGSKDDVDNSQGRAASQLVVAEAAAETQQQTFAGKEPRTRAEILNSLRNVKGLSDELAPAGPLQKGLLPGSPIVVASFKRQPAANTAVEKLRHAGLNAALARQGNLWQIYVAADEFEMATACLRTQVRAVSDPSIYEIHRPVKPGVITLVCAFLFGAIACLMLGMVIRVTFFNVSHAPNYELPQKSELFVSGCVSCGLFLMSYCLLHSWIVARTDLRPANEPAPGREYR